MILKKWHTLIYPIVCLYLMQKLMTIPSEINLFLVLFLVGIALLERIYMKSFHKIWLPYFIIVLGLIIFDKYSIFYGIFYVLTDLLYVLIKERVSILYNLIPTSAITLICIIIGNEFYYHTSQGYMARFATLLLLLVLNWILAYLLSFMEYGKMTTAPIITHFVPSWAEILVIFPILASFNYFDYPVVLTTFLLYLIIVKLCHTRFMSVDEEDVQYLVAKIRKKDGLAIKFMDLGEIKGVYIPARKWIAIDEKMDYPEQIQTIFHEWLHYKLRGQKLISKFTEEIIVTVGEAIISSYFILKIKKTYN